MSIETSKKILKIFGVMCVIGSVIFMTAILVVVFAGSYFITLTPEELNGIDLEIATNEIFFGTLSLVVRCILTILQGIYCVRSVKDRQYIMAAWVFSVIVLIISTLGFVSLFLNASIPALTFLFSVLNAVSSLLLCIAAYTLKNYNEDEKIEETVPEEDETEETAPEQENENE